MQIRVSPDFLRNTAEQQKQIIGSLSETTSTINELRTRLSDAWEGASGSQACNALEEIRDGMKSVIDGAEDSAEKLISVANAFESIDEGQGASLIMKKLPTGYIPYSPFTPRVFSFSVPGQVRIDPDTVRDIADQCKVVATKIIDNADSFSSTIRGLQDNWEGKAYLKYEDETREIIKGLGQIQEAVEEFITRIVNAANRYEEIDNSF